LGVDASGAITNSLSSYLAGSAENVFFNTANYRGLTLNTATSAHRPTLSFRNANGAGAIAYIQGDGQALAFGRAGQDYGGHQESLRITSAGLVGVGTSTPATNLHIGSGAGGSDLGLLLSRGATTNFFEAHDGTKNFIAGTDSSNAFVKVGSLTNHPVAIVQSNAEAIYIDTSKRVGIGTTSPAQLLHLNSPSANATQWIAAGSGYTSNLSLLANGSGGGLLLSSATDSSASITNSLNAALTFGTNNTERARIDSSGRLLVGTSSARDKFFNTTYTPQLQLEGVGQQQSFFSLTNSVADNGGPVIGLAKQRSGSIGGNTIVNNGDAVGQIDFFGSDGTEMVALAEISASVDGTPGANDMPGRIVLSTTADGASSPTERMRIPNGGGLSVGSTVNPNALTQASGIRLGSSTIANHDFTNITTSPVNIANGVGIGGLAFVQAYNTANGAQYTGIVMWRAGIVAVVSESNALGFGLTYTVSGSTLYLQTASGTISGSVITLAG
jgi:hypothetical protein